MNRPAFGEALRGWRTRRRMSQLDLALDAGVSSRHVAFLETGRARPSRLMVDQLIDALDVPLRDRNELLVTAGFAPLYTKCALDDPALQHLRAGLGRLLQSHEPYPGLLLDRDWTIVQANRTAGLMLDLIGGDPANTNLLTRLANGDRTAEVIENWPEVAAEFAARLKADALKTGDLDMLVRVEQFRARVAGQGEQSSSAGFDGPLFSLRFHLPDGRRLSLFSVIGQFSAARDITAAELRIELFFPSDEKTRMLLEQL